MEILIVLISYLLIMQVIGIFITIHDKRSAKDSKWRIKESTLLLVSALGGSLGMLFTMHKIRHKTQKKKFMIGIPGIMIMQVALIILVAFYLL